VNEPENGLESLSALLPILGVSRHYYRGTLERVGASEPFSVLLDGRRTTVAAVHVKGTLTFSDRTITPQIWWLDDATNPLTLKWIVGSVYETVTRIDRPIAGTGGTTIVDGLAGKTCRAELSGVYFTTASAEVLEASMPALERFAALINQHPDWRITVEGHTDNIGPAAYNVDLSTRRAAAVREVLIRRFAVPAARLQSRGYGLTRPVETNGTDEGRAHNRRVEVSRQCNS
jgi:outer membrane protein OmpA-like peptidoglycan-associated protein